MSKPDPELAQEFINFFQKDTQGYKEILKRVKHFQKKAKEEDALMIYYYITNKILPDAFESLFLLGAFYELQGENDKFCYCNAAKFMIKGVQFMLKNIDRANPFGE